MSSLIPVSRINLRPLESRRPPLPPIPSSSPKPCKFNVRGRAEITATSNGPSILCEPCKGSGWVICDFCNGKKTNVPSETRRIHRRCPSCRAIGVILCSKCMVYKCVTFPDYRDAGELPSV
ncbi:hypothetical protein MLD38_028695 [Melastoma candidum]|uniref:Uncharacterized protein n=1 Tax=Melastoma candidum TaxID=119954 RepID=A0ACB9N2L3_9MYRT|nr:hypothetical protein MLD38_028695 [Melastoma candidum]